MKKEQNNFHFFLQENTNIITKDPIFNITVLLDGRIAACLKDFSIRIYNKLSYMEDIVKHKAHYTFIYDIIQLPNEVIMSSSYELRFWVIKQDKNLREFLELIYVLEKPHYIPGEICNITKLSYLDENFIISGGEDNSIIIWKIYYEEEIPYDQIKIKEIQKYSNLEFDYNPKTLKMFQENIFIYNEEENIICVWSLNKNKAESLNKRIIKCNNEYEKNLSIKNKLYDSQNIQDIIVLGDKDYILIIDGINYNFIRKIVNHNFGKITSIIETNSHIILISNEKGVIIQYQINQEKMIFQSKPKEGRKMMKIYELNDYENKVKNKERIYVLVENKNIKIIKIYKVK